MARFAGEHRRPFTTTGPPRDEQQAHGPSWLADGVEGIEPSAFSTMHAMFLDARVSRKMASL